MFFFSRGCMMMKYLFIIILSFTVASCSTFQSNNKKDLKQDSGVTDYVTRSESNEVEVSSQVGIDTVAKSDPMGNIQINSEIKKAYKQAASLIKQKKLPKALNLMIKIKAKYPQLSGPNYQMARIYLLQKKHEKAIEQVDVSLTKNTRNYYSLSLKGVILKAQGKFKDAKASYLQAIQIYPYYSKSHLNLGVLADVYLGELDLALSEYKTYMKLTSNKDKKVANWVLEVKRRINSTK